MRLLGEAREAETAAATARATAREASLAEKLEASETALARAEAKMVRVARDLAEAEDELEARDAAEASRLEGLAVGPTTARRSRTDDDGGARARRRDARSPSREASRASFAPDASKPASGADHDIFSKVRNNRHGEVEALLASGAVSPNARDGRGNTILVVAAQNNRKRAAKAAVRAGVPLDARNAKGNTAMHFALAYGYRDVAEYLVRKGADPTVTNDEGLRPDQGLTVAKQKKETPPGDG